MTPDNCLPSQSRTNTPRLSNLSHVGGRQRLDHTGAFAEAGAEDAVGILEHAVLETNDNELGALEARLDEAADVLRMRQVECCVDLVQNVHGRRLELQEGHDEG